MSFPGSRWWRFDLHNHSPASSDYRGNKQITPQEWLLDYMRAEVDAVAITDHNCANWIDPLKAALAAMQSLASADRPAGYRDLVLFPGVELTTHDGIHLLAIFDPSADAHTVAGLIALAGCSQQADNHNAMCEKGSLEIAKQVRGRNGLVIAAHTDQVNGVHEPLRDSTTPRLMRGDREINMLLDHLDALQVVDHLAPHLQSLLPALGKRFPLIAASDAHKPKAAGSAVTWIKCTIPTLQGLKLALLDHELAVRRADSVTGDPNRVPSHWIRAVELKDFRERRGPTLKVGFNPAFNALIGGRGTGKSTLVESARLAACRTSDFSGLREDGEVRRAFDRFAQATGALMPNSLIALDYERDGETYRLSYNQLGKAQVVSRITENGQCEPIPGMTPAQIGERWPVRVLSQKQVFELSGSPRALLDLIDNDPRLAKAEWQREFDELARRFKALRADRRLVQQRMSSLAVREDELAQINRKLRAFEQGNVGDKLKAFQHASLQREIVEDRFKIAESLFHALDENLKKSSFIRPGRFDEFTPENAAESDALARLQIVDMQLKALPIKLHQLIVDARKEVERSRQQILASEWNRQVDATIQSHSELVARMQQVGIDSPKAYAQLTLDKQRIERDLLDLQVERTRETDLSASISDVYNSLCEKRVELTAKRRRFIAAFVKPNNDALRQTIREMGDTDSAERQLREALDLDGTTFDRDIHWTDGTTSIGIVAELGQSPGIREQWKRACAALDGQSRTVLGVTLGAKLQSRLKEKTAPEKMDELLTRFPEDELVLEYRQGSDYKRIDQGSAGQRSAAVLSFLLAFGDEPLIIDQPEDDLDNAMVYELVVMGIRDNKARRQLIIATHNANIVVNGDAEYVLPMRYLNGSIDLDPGAGGLQEAPIREQICEIMEGGRVAFEMRYKKVLKDLQ